MKNICKNCKHWKVSEEQPKYWDDQTVEEIRRYKFEIGECSSSKMIYWNFPLDKDNKGKEIEIDSLVYYDYDSYQASIETAENFGCIHFEAKP